MSDFINTIEALGDEATLDGIIQRTITEFKDDTVTSLPDHTFNTSTALKDVNLPDVTSLGTSVFADCTALETAQIPELTSVGATVFQGCSSLKSVDFPKLKLLESSLFNGCSALTSVSLPEADVKAAGSGVDYATSAFRGCSSLETLKLPKLSRTPGYFFYGCTALKTLDLPVCTIVGGGYVFNNCSKLKALILRNTETVAALGSVFNNTCGIASGTGYIYVPSALIDSYKAATNWSTYADQFRALEDWTADGTVTGEFSHYEVGYTLSGVTSSNTVTETAHSFSTTLTPTGSDPIKTVSVTMGGVDVTESVYSNGVVDIPVVTGNIVIKAHIYGDEGFLITPYDGSTSGELPRFRMDVTAGTTLQLTYYLSKNQGYLYDGRGCGLGHVLKNNVINTVTTITVTVPSNGYIVFGDYYGATTSNGALATNASDRPYGEYIRVVIV